VPLNIGDLSNKMKVEDANLAEEDIIIIELIKNTSWCFVPLHQMNNEESKFNE
jgi:hypothetical protein